MNQSSNYYYSPNGQGYSGYYQPPIDPRDIERKRKKQIQKKEKSEILSAGFVLGCAIIAYLTIQSIAILMLDNLGIKQAYDSSSAIQYLYNVLAVHICSMLLPFSVAALILKKRFIAPAVPTKKLGKLPFWSWVSFGMATCYLANIFVSFVISLVKQFGYELTKSEYSGPKNLFDCVAIIISVMIVPAIIEELAMRCFSLGVLAKHGKGFAVFGVSIVFGLLHGNVIQFIFAFLIGLILGYITIKTDSVLPAMAIHGFNNGLSALQEIITLYAGKKASTVVIEILFLAWLIAGVIGFLYLIKSKRFFFKKSERQKSPYALNIFTKIACLLPGMALPILILVYLSYKTIVKI